MLERRRNDNEKKKLKVFMKKKIDTNPSSYEHLEGMFVHDVVKSCLGFCVCSFWFKGN